MPSWSRFLYLAPLADAVCDPVPSTPLPLMIIDQPCRPPLSTKRPLRRFDAAHLVVCSPPHTPPPAIFALDRRFAFASPRLCSTTWIVPSACVGFQLPPIKPVFAPFCCIPTRLFSVFFFFFPVSSLCQVVFYFLSLLPTVR